MCLSCWRCWKMPWLLYPQKNQLIHHWNAVTSRLETSSVFNNLGKIEQIIPLYEEASWGGKIKLSKTAVGQGCLIRSPSWQEVFYDSQISNQKAVPAGTASLTLGWFITGQGKEGSIVCCLPWLCLSLCHLPSGSVTPNLMPVRTDPWKHKEAVKWFPKFLTLALLRPDPSSQWESTHWCCCALNQALMKPSPALPFSPMPAPITSCQIPNWTGAWESNFHVLVSALLNLSTMAEESSLTHIDENHLVMNLVPTSFSHPMTYPLREVLQPLAKLSCSPGSGSHGKWCFPI